jgi:xylan 1,4-beta-xylosidase
MIHSATQATKAPEHLQRALTLIAALGLLSVMPAYSQEAAAPASEDVQAITLAADAHSQGLPLVHFWSKVVGAGRANEGLRVTWQDELATVSKYDGFKYVRFHGLFHDDMFIYREDEQGKPIYNFQYIDDVFDRMLQKGVRPFVELGFVPKELSAVQDTTFWWRANGSPPSDYGKWADLVHATVEHWVARYGIVEVRTWYFEVWNEPNLTKPFFRGTQQQYFDLYKTTVQTIKKIDPALRVGGPATSNFHMDQQALTEAQASGKPFDPNSIPWVPIWITDFMQYCKTNDLPVDFISTHPYPQDFAIDEPGMPKGGHYRRSIDSTRNDLTTLRRMIDAGPYPHAEIQLTEWSSSPSPLDHSHDSLAAGSFIAKTNLESIGLVDSLSYWVFTDVFEENRKTDSVFHGGFGLINYQEIVKPAFHAYRMMNQLGDQLLSQTPGAIVTRRTSDRKIVAMAYNYSQKDTISLPVTNSLEAADAIDASGGSRVVELQVKGLKPNTIFDVEILDRDHGNAVGAWEKMGRPEPPTREQAEQLKKEAWATQKDTIRANAFGVLALHRTLAPWGLMLIRER